MFVATKGSRSVPIAAFTRLKFRCDLLRLLARQMGKPPFWDTNRSDTADKSFSVHQGLPVDFDSLARHVTSAQLDKTRESLKIERPPLLNRHKRTLRRSRFE